MTNTPEQTISDLLALGKEATGGEWFARPWGDGSNADGFCNVVCDDAEWVLVADTLIDDAAFIAASKNALPAIRFLMEEVKGLREDARDLIVKAFVAGATAVHENPDPGNPDPEFGEAAHDYAEEALSRLGGK